MLNRIVLSHSRGPLLRQLVRRSHETHIPDKYLKFRPAHLDELLVPSGDWTEAYNKLQSKYNKQLAASVIFAAVTLGYVFSSGVIDLVLAPPLKNE